MSTETNLLHELMAIQRLAVAKALHQKVCFTGVTQNKLRPSKFRSSSDKPVLVSNLCFRGSFPARKQIMPKNSVSFCSPTPLQGGSCNESLFHGAATIPLATRTGHRFASVVLVIFVFVLVPVFLRFFSSCSCCCCCCCGAFSCSVLVSGYPCGGGHPKSI